jgi:hypothetical protein
MDALVQRGRIWKARLVPGYPHRRPGDSILWMRPGSRDQPAVAGSSATRRAASAQSALRAGMGGHGLSHPQDGPLTLTGAAELQPGPGPCGQLRSRTADRMAVPCEPFH